MLRTSKRRAREENETLELISPFIKRLDISSINNISLDKEIKCYTYEIRKKSTISGYLNLGKGFSEIGAKVSGLMEALEMSVIEMKAPIEWYSQTCFRNIEKNEKEVISENSAMNKKYIYGEELITCTSIKQKYSEIVYLDKKLHAGKNINRNKTNGLASGNSIEEATIHAIYELIERHHISNYRVKPLAKIINMEKSAEFQQIITKLTLMGVRTTFYILGVMAESMTVECCLTNETGKFRQSYECQGWGCSDDANIACSRALAEAIQGLALALALENDSYGLSSKTKEEDGYGKEISNYRNDVKHRQGGFISMREKAKIKKMDAKYILSKSTERKLTLKKMIEQLKNEGYKTIERFTLTKETLPFSVVKIIVPGLDCPRGL